MSSYFDSKNKSDCNGCGICALKCPKNAISIKTDNEGFLYPVIDESKCIKCGLCMRICSNNITDMGKNISNYVAINKDESIRKLSTSGGIFNLLLKSIIDKDGVVFGAVFDDELNIKHTHVDNIEDSIKLSGSKYVRSDLNNSFLDVLKYLKNDKYVLFSGTPCQCYALRKFLGCDYDKLLICDVYCHSNPSPKIYKTMINALEKKKEKKIKNIYFRGNKLLNIKYPYVEFEDESISDIKSYHESFINMAISRPSCSNCKFRSINRLTDITLGDYWGNTESFKMDTKYGISLISINTNKGKKFFNLIKEELEYVSVNLDNYKFNRNRKIHEKRYEFFRNVNEENILSYMKKMKKSLLQKIIKKINKRKKYD